MSDTTFFSRHFLSGRRSPRVVLSLFGLPLAGGLMAMGGLTALPALAQPELKGSPEELRAFLHPQEKTTSLRGEAEEKAYTDIAIVSIMVTTEDNLYGDALDANSRVQDSIRQQLMAQGIDTDAIKNARFSSSPDYGWFGKKPDRYKVNNRMSVKLTDSAHMKALATIVDTVKEAEIIDTKFEHTGKDAAMESAKRKALQKILAQKALYEKTLGVKLSAVNVRQGGVYAQPQVYETRQAKRADSLMVSAARAKLSDDAESVPAQSFDEVVYRATITVEYKVEAAQ